MHELSIVMSILETAKNELGKVKESSIESIELEIGLLSGIEIDALNFAWKISVENTVLQNAKKIICRPEGIAECTICNKKFKIDSLFDPCPFCYSFNKKVISGKELKIKRLTVI